MGSEESWYNGIVWKVELGIAFGREDMVLLCMPSLGSFARRDDKAEGLRVIK